MQHPPQFSMPTARKFKKAIRHIIAAHMRLQKFLAHSGFGARRKCETFIFDGRVTINGTVATIGQSVQPGDEVCVDGAPIKQQQEKVYIALHKPMDYSSDLGDARNKSMFELVSTVQQHRLFGVGRLDKDSSGLILLTNDGDFAYRLTHPKFEHEKEYRVLVKGVPNEAALLQWRTGVLLEGEETKTAPAQISIADTQRIETREFAWLRITMHEGRKRQIRRIARMLGHPVIKLSRVRVGSVTLGTLQSGEWRTLTKAEVQALLTLTASPEPAKPPRQSNDKRQSAPDHTRRRQPANHRD